MIADSILVSIYLNIQGDPSPQTNNFIFISFILFFMMSNYFFLRYTRFRVLTGNQGPFTRNRLIDNMIFYVQSGISLTLIYIIVQIMTYGYYSLSSMVAIVYVSYIFAIGFLIFLVYLFARWYSAGRSYLILGYMLAFAMIIGTLIISLTYLTLQFSYHDDQVNLKSIKATIINYSIYGSNLIGLGTIYTYFSIISFSSVWLLSILLLRTYSIRLGRLLYWTVVSIPLIFFLFPIISSKLGLLDSLFFEFGHSFVIFYYIMFSPYQQIGGLMFGVVFWVLASRIRRTELKILLNTAGIGIVMLFGSSVVHGLTYIVAPPFGLITVSYLSLAAYLLVTGIYKSTKEISIDSDIRREIHKIAEEQFTLLRNISIADLVSKSEHIVNTAIQKVQSNEYPITQVTDEVDYRNYLQEVLEELSSQKSMDKDRMND